MIVTGLVNVKNAVIKWSLDLPKLCSWALEAMPTNLTAGYLTVAYHSRLRNRFKSVLEFIARVDEDFEKILKISNQLDYPNEYSYKEYREIINQIAQECKKKKKSPSIASLRKLSNEEKDRIEESFHCLREKCYWSAVINGAVALEGRLFQILKLRSKKTLEGINSSLRFTLGALADAYLSNKGAFGNCIPKRHEHLLKHINEYRIISAHPKQFKVDKKTADGIFNFTLAFLLDEECEPPKKKGRPKKTS